MYIFLVVVIAAIALLMTIVILLQSGRGSGLAGIAAGDSTRQMLGARQAPDLLEKATWTMATIFIVLCVLTNFAVDRGGQQESVIQQETQQTQTPGGAPQQPQQPGSQQALPGQGGQQQQQGAQPLPGQGGQQQQQ